MSNAELNPLLARRRRTRGLIVSLCAGFAVLATGAIAVSAQTARPERTPAQPPQIQIASAELRGGETAQPEKRRQVRVIPLFNAPVNPTGK